MSIKIVVIKTTHHFKRFPWLVSI